jgi:hypothetical protein
VCQYASKELDIGHTSVDFSTTLFKNMFNANEEFHTLVSKILEFLRYLVYILTLVSICSFFLPKHTNVNLDILTEMESNVTVHQF